MTHFNSILTSLALVSGAFGQDKHGDRHREEGRKGPPRPEEFLKAYDLDNDKKVSKEEFGTGDRASRLDPAIREKIFSRLDKNADGFISMKELKSMAPKKGHHPLAKADLNKDGRISKEEFVAHGHFAKMPEERRAKMFTRLDRNSDGFLDQKDGHLGGRRGGRGDKHPLRFKMKGLDVDGSGSLSWEEFQNAPSVLSLTEAERRKAFEKLDADNNGEVSASELRPQPGHMEKRSRPKK